MSPVIGSKPTLWTGMEKKQCSNFTVFDRLKKTQRGEKLKPQGNNSELKQKIKVSAKFEKKNNKNGLKWGKYTVMAMIW